MADQVQFELVSPERLLTAAAVDMVVIPGSEGDFGVLPRHAPLVSTIRPGVIRTFAGREVKERIFVAGGFAEVTPERCTVLAEEAMPVEQIDRGDVEQQLKNLREDLADAKSENERRVVERRIKIREAMLAAAG